MNDRQRFQGRANRPSGGRSNGQQGGGGQQGGRSGGHRQRNNNGRGSGGGGGGGNRNNNGQRREEIVAAPLVDGIAEGLLSIPDNDRSDGTLRDPAHPLRPARGNIIVPRALIRELNLRPGLMLKGIPNGKSLNKVDTVEGKTIDEYRSTTPLYDATAMDPEPVLKLEHDPAELTTRIIDILTPVGFGQRGLIVAPPARAKRFCCRTWPRASTTIIPMWNWCSC